MSNRFLIRSAAVAAIVAGVLRALASFLPGAPVTFWLECLYFVTDVSILFGTLGIFAVQYGNAGRIGFAGFVVATIGIASIIGPDGELGGVSMYTAGASVYALGLCVFAAGTWRAHVLPRWIPVFWVVSTVAGFAGFFVSGLGVLFVVSGVVFGLSYAGAGVMMWRMAATA